MKINVTYEASDIERLVRNDLVRQGMQVSDADIKFADNEVRVSITATVEDAPAAPPAPTPMSVAPSLAVVDGGNQPVDMSDVLSASARAAQDRPPLYPTRDRELMEGESHDFPGVPRR